ncbi:MAG: hypothetical protein ACREUD_05450 [Gammaproteobacteria bacterium]
MLRDLNRHGVHLHFHSHDNRVLHGHLHAHDRSVSRRSHAGDPHAHEHGAVLVPRRYWRFYLCHSSDRLGSASPICALGLGVLVAMMISADFWVV